MLLSSYLIYLQMKPGTAEIERGKKMVTDHDWVWFLCEEKHIWTVQGRSIFLFVCLFTHSCNTESRGHLTKSKGKTFKGVESKKYINPSIFWIINPYILPTCYHRITEGESHCKTHRNVKHFVSCTNTLSHKTWLNFGTLFLSEWATTRK